MEEKSWRIRRRELTTIDNVFSSSCLIYGIVTLGEHIIQLTIASGKVPADLKMIVVKLCYGSSITAVQIL